VSAALQQIYDPGDRLSPSSVNTYAGCGARWWYRYVGKEKEATTGNLAVGSAVHHSVMSNLAEKIESKQDLPLAGAIALFREEWVNLVRGESRNRFGYVSEPVAFREDEDPAELMAMGEKLVQLYIEQACPSIEPASIEREVWGTIGGVQVKAFVDILDVHGKVIDLKTAAKSPSKISSDHALQLTTYKALMPDEASGECEIHTVTKTKAPALHKMPFTVGPEQLRYAEVMYPAAQFGIKKGVFLAQRGNYLCSRKYCSFWRQCESDFGGKVPE
jgi:CRISPR/Cas system-associated exonuclease Cas4 (RecB family)